MNPEIIHHGSGGVAASVAAGTAMLGTALGVVNPILQTIAYCVSIVAGICAVVKYIRKS